MNIMSMLGVVRVEDVGAALHEMFENAIVLRRGKIVVTISDGRTFWCQKSDLLNGRGDTLERLKSVDILISQIVALCRDRALLTKGLKSAKREHSKLLAANRLLVRRRAGLRGAITRIENLQKKG